jgi:NAD(P)-dependent dehydrogenase (short-subunit alcohol dehydrogenase family)
MGKIDGKVAIITGAASGIGKATALLFAQEGANVVVADFMDELGEETVKVINESGGKAVFVHTDVSKAEDVKNMIKTAVDTYGRLDIIFNNAGIEGASIDTANYPENVFDKVIAVNLKGVWLGIKYALPELLKNGGGSIINTTSVAGLVAFAGLSAYNATKGGIIQLTKTAAIEYAKQNIRVNCIAPGVIETAMVDRVLKAQPEAKAAFIQIEPVGRFGKPEEVAKAALFLASDDSSFITGTVLIVDGGLTAQ